MRHGSSAGDRGGSAMGSAASQGGARSISDSQYFPLHPEQWKDKIMELKELSTIRFPKIFQCVFYYLKFRERQYLCERDTNKLLWKKAKLNINEDLFAKLGDYWPIGPKEESFKEYEKFAWIKNALAGITEEEVDEFSVALGKLYRWLLLAIETRTENVKQRRAAKKAANDLRQQAITAEEERMKKR